MGFFSDSVVFQRQINKISLPSENCVELHTEVGPFKSRISGFITRFYASELWC